MAEELVRQAEELERIGGVGRQTREFFGGGQGFVAGREVNAQQGLEGEGFEAEFSRVGAGRRRGVVVDGATVETGLLGEGGSAQEEGGGEFGGGNQALIVHEVEHGAALMTEELARLQYHDLHNFARAALPRELALLVVEGVRVPLRAESDNPMSAVLQAVAAIERDTDELIYQLGEYQELINGLGSWAGGVRSVIDRANRVGSLMEEVTSLDGESSVPTVSERVKERGAQAVEVLRQLNSSLVALYEAASEVRFRSSMMRLHTLMAGIFAAAVLDGQEGESADAIGDLAEAMLSDLEELVPSCQEAANLAERLEGDLRTVVSNLDRVKRPFQRWIRALQDEGAQALVDGVDAEAALQEAVTVGEQGFPETASLAELAAKARGVVVTLDEPVIRERVATVRETLSHLGE